MLNVNMINIGLFIIIVILLVSMFFTNKKKTSKKFVKIYLLNIIILCFVLGSYIYDKHSGINSIFVPIVYILVILLNLQQIIIAIKSKRD